MHNKCKAIFELIISLYFMCISWTWKVGLWWCEAAMHRTHVWCHVVSLDKKYVYFVYILTRNLMLHKLGNILPILSKTKPAFIVCNCREWNSRQPTSCISPWQRSCTRSQAITRRQEGILATWGTQQIFVKSEIITRNFTGKCRRRTHTILVWILFECKGSHGMIYCTGCPCSSRLLKPFYCTLQIVEGLQFSPLNLQFR